nr:hypothetical protein [Pseudoxanthomonas sp.]
MKKSNKNLAGAGLAVAIIGGLFVFWQSASQLGRAEPKAIEVPTTGQATTAAAPSPAISQAAPSVASSVVDASPPSVQQLPPFERSQTCYFAHIAVNSLREALVSCKSLEGIREVESTYKQCAQQLGVRQAELEDKEATLAQCPGDELKLASDYYASTKAAAAQGNADAQLCYLQSAYGTLGVYSDQDARDYDRDAPRYVQMALQRGDWRIVSLLGTKRLEPASGLLSRLVKGDLQTQYQMNRLARLGAAGEYANQLDLDARHSLLAKERLGADALTPQQIAEADARAREMYKKYFSKAGPLRARPLPCPSR